MKPPPTKYIAQLKKVRELTLLGAAELSWWRDYLAAEELEPIEVDGQAQVMVTGLDSQWMGIPFRDLSVAVAARSPSGLSADGFFFARAFNASLFHSGFERWWFHLPYSCRAVRVELGTKASMRLGHEPDVDLFAEMEPREPSVEPPQEMGYTGPLFLPKGRTKRRWLMVRIHGLTSTFDFDAERDRFEVRSDIADPVLAGLHASRFRGIQ